MIDPLGNYVIVRTAGINKVPTSRPVTISAPGPKGSGASGLAGDVICDAKNRGGDCQAVYAFAREDLDWWQADLGETAPGGRVRGEPHHE